MNRVLIRRPSGLATADPARVSGLARLTGNVDIAGYFRAVFGRLRIINLDRKGLRSPRQKHQRLSGATPRPATIPSRAALAGARNGHGEQAWL
jgi:hypothetical protein